jgi:Flp pilus assembly protein TadG
MNSKRRKQGGVAAVEFAVILPLIIIMLAFPVFFARMFMHYSVAQKAAHDAAIYLANIPAVEMSNYERSLDATDVANALAREELGELRPGGGTHALVAVLCDGGPCGTATPAVVSVEVRMRMYDDTLNFFTWEAIGGDGIELRAKASATYVGN